MKNPHRPSRNQGRVGACLTEGRNELQIPATPRVTMLGVHKKFVARVSCPRKTRWDSCSSVPGLRARRRGTSCALEVPRSRGRRETAERTGGDRENPASSPGPGLPNFAKPPGSGPRDPPPVPARVEPTPYPRKSFSPVLRGPSPPPARASLFPGVRAQGSGVRQRRRAAPLTGTALAFFFH